MTHVLTFSRAIRLADSFTTLPDLTIWKGDYRAPPKGTRKVMTPDRERATFGTAGRGLKLKAGLQLPHAHGIYVLAFREPYPAIYIGLAADDGAAPEGILTRLRKHRVKATGSHIASEPNAGGIHHPPRWGLFAAERHHAFAGRGKIDLLEDVTILIGSLGVGLNAKRVTSFFEGQLNQAGELRRMLISHVFDGEVASVFSLNTLPSGGIRPGQASVVFHGCDPVAI